MKNKIQERFENLCTSLTTEGKLPYAAFLLERAAELWPERIALEENEITITFKTLYKSACQVSHFLEKQEVKAGECIIILWENSIDFYKIYYGIWQTGAVVTPLNTFLHEKELAYIIEHAQPTVIITSSNLKEKVLAARKERACLIFTEKELFSEQTSFHSYPIKNRDPQEMAVLLYTSGTTGFPKGVMLSSENILINSMQGVACFSITDQERIYAALPLFHSYMQNTAVWSPFLVGACTIIVPKIERKSLQKGLEKNPTIVFGIPGLFGLLCLMKTASFEKVKYFICGGDALSDKIRAYFELLYHRKLCNGYGLTETSPFLCVNFVDEIAPTSKVGLPLYGIEISIRDDLENEVVQGSIGTVWVKGKNIMLGYYRDPELTKQVIKNGWFNTADMGYLDKEGALILSGRHSDLIKNKGMKIYPQEIENVLMLHPDVMAVAVVGIVENDEEVPIAFIASNKNKVLLKEDLQELCKKNIAAYKMPHRYIIRSQLPMTVTGKVDKKLLKKEYNESTHSASYIKP